MEQMVSSQFYSSLSDRNKFVLRFIFTHENQVYIPCSSEISIFYPEAQRLGIPEHCPGCSAFHWLTLLSRAFHNYEAALNQQIENDLNKVLKDGFNDATPSSPAQSDSEVVEDSPLERVDSPERTPEDLEVHLHKKGYIVADRAKLLESKLAENYLKDGSIKSPHVQAALNALIIHRIGKDQKDA